MTKLVMVEGLPCSGKSTTARALAAWLGEQGVPTQCVDEGSGSHPADYEFDAWLSDGEIAAWEPPARCELFAVSRPVCGGRVIPLAAVGDELRQALLPHKIYDALPWETEAPLFLHRWAEFAAMAKAGESVFVLNCVLLQNTLCEMMMRFDLPMEQIEAHLKAIAALLAPLRPVVCYLQNDDVAALIRRTEAERPGWLDAMVAYHCGGAYGKRIGANGFDGLIACLAERQKREIQLLSRLPLQGMVFPNAANDRDRTLAAIQAVLLP